MAENPAPRSNKNWLLVKFRQWHSWGGVFLSLFILVVAVTGIILNHKDFFLIRQRQVDPSGLLTSTTDFATLPVGFSQALALARGHFGEVSLEKIELKDEHGQLMYKVARGEGDEIRIDARTGEVSTKYGMSLTATGKSTLNWGKIIDDLHTGKIFGLFGKLTVDFTSGVIIALTLTGIYLWGIPMLLKRRNALKRQNAATAPVPRPSIARERAQVEVQ